MPLMSAGSSIVNLSSIAGLAGWGPVHYASAKGAILGFTRASSRELGGLGIRINAVAPGVVETPMTEDLDEALLAPLIMMSLLVAWVKLKRSLRQFCIYLAMTALSLQVSGFHQMAV